MKFDRLFIGLTAAILASLLALGAVGSLVTGFALPLDNPETVYFLCISSAALFCLLFSLKWGVTILLFLAAFLGGWLWHRGIFLQQLLSLLVRISKFYHNAYQWGYFLFEVEPMAADLPLAVLGGIIALAVGGALVRSKQVIFPLILSALPLAACMVVTDTVPDTVFLFLWFLGFLLTILPQSVRRENPAQGCRLTVLMALPVLLALGLLFHTVPEKDYVNQSEALQEKLLAMAEEIPQKASQQMQQLTGGLQDDADPNLNLKSLGPRPRYTHAVMEVTASTGGAFYLRGQDYDVYTGTGWTASPHRAEYFGTEEALTQTLSLSTRGTGDVLYLPYYPGRDTILAGGTAKNNEKQTQYTLSYSPLPENWQELLEAEEASGSTRIEYTQLELSQFGSTADRLRYTTLPGETKVMAKAILDRFLPQGADRLEAAEAIGDYVRNSARYDLNTGRMDADAEDFAIWFLEDSDTGYCVHFATAAVVLLRAADIPARYVTGYLTQTQPGQAVTVTAGEAHAWAEYYVPQLETWVVLEATPTEEILQEVPVPSLPPETREPLPPVTESPMPGTTEPSLPTEIPTSPSEPETNAGFPWLLPLAAVLLIFLQRKFRIFLRNRKLTDGNANRRALKLWLEAVQLAKLLGQTPPDALQELAQKAKFSQHTITREELAEFYSFLAQCRQELKEKPWYWQLVYRWVFVIY